MKKVLGVLLGLIALIIIGIVGVTTLSNVNAGPISTIAQDAKAGFANAIMDTTDIKGQVQSAIESNKDSIAAAMGVPSSMVDAAVENLAIDEWQAASLPSDATAVGTVNGSSMGIDGAITTYDDPSYITLEAYGQNVTLAVPESAQQYLQLLATQQ